MSLNVPDLIKSAVPEAEGRNVQILSQNGPNHRDAGFLSQDFPRSPPRLYIIAEEDSFDELTVAEWRDEGFDVEYFSMESCTEGFVNKLRSLSKEKMNPCEKFGIVGECMAKITRCI